MGCAPGMAAAIYEATETHNEPSTSAFISKMIAGSMNIGVALTMFGAASISQAQYLRAFDRIRSNWELKTGNDGHSSQPTDQRIQSNHLHSVLSGR
jgi:hypothetical protein